MPTRARIVDFRGESDRAELGEVCRIFDGQLFDVYENKKVDIALIEAGQDSQGEHALNRMLARSKFDLEETSNRIKDRRFYLEDRIRQSGMPSANADRIMRAFNRAYAVAIEYLQTMSINALLEFAKDDDLDN